MSKNTPISFENFSREMTQNFFWGVCVDSSDPLMLGRARIKPLDKNIEQVIKSAQKNGFDENSTSEKNGPWSDKDPFIYLSFLPFFINQVPKVDERVMLFYFDRKRMTGRNKFYMIAPYSSPTTIKQEDFRSSKTHLDDGYDNSLISLPNIKNVTGSYYDPSKKGVFAEPVDISINGRDNADLIIKEDEVLLRAGKHFKFERGQIPVPNDNRAFLQLTKLDKIQRYGEPESYTKFVERNDQIKYLIEYYCNTMNTSVDVFTGGVRIYKLPEVNSYETQVKFFDYDTTLSGISSLPILYDLTIQAKPLQEFTSIIIETIRKFHSEPNGITSIQKDSNFPFYFRPSETIRKVLKDYSGNVDVKSIENMTNLLSKIVPSVTNITPGYGLVYKGFKTPPPFDKVDEITVPVKIENLDNTVSALGGDQIYLLSHKTSIPGKTPIVLSDSIYGITANTFVDIIEPNTSGMVRGDELLELLQLIVNFLVTHDHPYPMLPPSPISRSSSITTDDVLKKMQEAYTKVLNSNIRIN